MKQFAFVLNGIVTEIVPETVTVDHVDYPLAARYPEGDIARMIQAPEGVKIAPGWTYDGTQFSPPSANSAEPIEPAVAFTWKTDIWDRCTEEEAAALDAGLKEAPVKERRMWDDSTMVMHNNPLYGVLRDTFAARFDADRAAAVFAPSVG